MMKLVVFSDPHVFPFPEHATLVNGVNSRLLDTLKVFVEARSYCDAHEIDLVVIAGDVFHKRGVVQTDAYNRVVKELARFKKAGIRVICIDGNHDHADRGGVVHAIEGLHRAGLVEAIVPGMGWGFWDHRGLPIHGFSYCDDRDVLSRRIDDACAATAERGLAFFHHGFKGARVGTHLEYEVREPISAKKRIGDRWPTVRSGHYHSHQPIEGVENGWYVGSPMEFTRATIDEANDKGFMVMDAETGEHEIVPLGLPRFVRISEEDFGLGALEAARGNFVDLDHSGDAARLEEYLREAGARGWRFTRRPKAQAPRAGAVDPRTPPAQALGALLEVKADEIREMGLDREAVFELGKELLSRAAEE